MQVKSQGRGHGLSRPARHAAWNPLPEKQADYCSSIIQESKLDVFDVDLMNAAVVLDESSLVA